MSTTSETVRINRTTLEALKEKASELKEYKLLREAVKVGRDRERRDEWAAAQGRSVVRFKGESAEEVQMIQNRSAIRSAGVGALLALIANLDSIKNQQYLKDHWWLLPLGVLALGWVMKNRGYKDAPTILTFGGVMLVQAYQRHQKDEDDKKKAQAQAPQAAPLPLPAPQPSPNTGAPDTGAIHAVGNHVWLQDPAGAWVKLSMPAALPAALPAYYPRFAAAPVRIAETGLPTDAPTQGDFEAAQQIAAAAFAG